MHEETGAAPVAPPAIRPMVGGSSERDRVITPYRADAFEKTLQRLNLIDKYRTLPQRLRNGFPIGEFDKLTRTYTPANYFRDPKHLEFVLKYVQEQVQLRRMSGPYTQYKVEEILGGPFMSSPLTVIDKAGSPGKFRLIQNCSRKNEDGFSMNDFIDPEMFPTTWGTASEVAQVIANAPPGAQAASLDIDSAYRNIPIRADHKPFLVIQVRPGEFYIDHVCPFGPRSGPGLQGQTMDAIVDILIKSGFEDIKKWVDDVVSFRFPIGRNWLGRWVYKYDVEDIFHVTKPLGVPWKPGKCFRYSFLVVYVGFLWDLRKRCVSLPEKKRENTLATVNAFFDKVSTKPPGKVTLRETTAVTGLLSHITFVYTAGRAYMTHLYAFVASFSDPPKSRTPQPPSYLVVSELQWWRNILQQTKFSRSLKPRKRCDPSVWVDASTAWGIGITIGGQWAAWKLTENWTKNGRDIVWAEMIALELACLYLEALGFKDADIVVHSDNVGVIAAFLKGWSKNPQANLSIGRAGLVCMSRNFKLELEHVKSEDNRADNLSRGIIPPSDTRRLPALPPPSLPPGIRYFLTCV